MLLPLSIEEQKRMVRGHEAMLLAIDKLVKAEKDLKDYKYSDNYKRAYKAAYTHLKEVAANEKNILTDNKKKYSNETGKSSMYAGTGEEIKGAGC